MSTPEVPFTDTGPGQSARLAIQVMGKDGDYFNPKGIRYLSPDQASPEFLEGLPSVGGLGGAGEMATVLSGADLLVSGGALTVATMALKSINEANRKLDEVMRRLGCLEARLGRVEERLEKLSEMVKRIDASVAEKRLLEAVRHLTSICAGDNEIDLDELARRVIPELDEMASILEAGELRLGDGAGLSFSAPLQDWLRTVYRLLFGLRCYLFSEANRRLDGDPNRCLSVDPIADYWPDDRGRPDNIVTHRLLDDLLEKKRGRALSWLSKYVFMNESKVKRWWGNSLRPSLFDMLDRLDPDAGRLSYDLPDFDTDDREEELQLLEDYKAYWLWETSAGLMWRTRVEAQALTDGYESFVQEGQAFPEVRVEQDALTLAAPYEPEAVDGLLSENRVAGRGNGAAS